VTYVNNKRRIYVFLALFLGIVGIQTAQSVEFKGTGSYLIKNVKVFNVHSRRFSKLQDVLVRNGKVSQIAAKIDEDKALVIQGKSRFLVPGFTEMHAHVP